MSMLQDGDGTRYQQMLAAIASRVRKGTVIVSKRARKMINTMFPVGHWRPSDLYPALLCLHAGRCILPGQTILALNDINTCSVCTGPLVRASTSEPSPPGPAAAPPGAAPGQAEGCEGEGAKGQERHDLLTETQRLCEPV